MSQERIEEFEDRLFTAKNPEAVLRLCREISQESQESQEAVWSNVERRAIFPLEALREVIAEEGFEAVWTVARTQQASPELLLEAQTFADLVKGIADFKGEELHPLLKKLVEGYKNMSDEDYNKVEGHLKVTFSALAPEAPPARPNPFKPGI